MIRVGMKMMITMKVKTMVIDGADTNRISDKRGGLS